MAHGGSTHTIMGEPYCERNCKGHQANQCLFERLMVTSLFSLRFKCMIFMFIDDGVAWYRARTYLLLMPKTLAFNYITKSAVEKSRLARHIIFDFNVALL